MICTSFSLEIASWRCLTKSLKSHEIASSPEFHGLGNWSSDIFNLWDGARIDFLWLTISPKLSKSWLISWTIYCSWLLSWCMIKRLSSDGTLPAIGSPLPASKSLWRPSVLLTDWMVQYSLIITSFLHVWTQVATRNTWHAKYPSFLWKLWFPLNVTFHRRDISMRHDNFVRHCNSTRDGNSMRHGIPMRCDVALKILCLHRYVDQWS